MINDRDENRQQIWDNYLADGGEYNKTVRHMFVDYSRYYEADLVRNTLSQEGVDLKKLKVLDYGCGVGDYGIELVRRGVKVDFYDFPRSTQFVTYRLGLEGLTTGRAISADHKPFKTFHETLGRYDLIIFGEVLEHLHNPLAILKICNHLKVKYIFTSSYPYRSSDPDDPYWHNHDHDDAARVMQPECQKVLEDNYEYRKFSGELRLWTRK